MTWKSTAAASGLMVIATWLASHAPVGQPREPASAAPSAAHTETAAAEIQREADRLHGRLEQVASYRVPARNLFRFSSAPAAPPPRQPAMTVEDAPAPALEPQPPSLRILLSGIAEDVAGDVTTRTAIISTPDDVFLVKVGDAIRDIYKVTNITADAVELARIDDGSVVTLSLRR